MEKIWNLEHLESL